MSRPVLFLSVSSRLLYLGPNEGRTGLNSVRLDLISAGSKSDRDRDRDRDQTKLNYNVNKT